MVPESKTTKPAANKSGAAKAPAKRKYAAGDNLCCKVCGLSVTVDENFAYKEKSLLMCCDAPMEAIPKKAAARD
jgi:hypothetical protein